MRGAFSLKFFNGWFQPLIPIVAVFWGIFFCLFPATCESGWHPILPGGGLFFQPSQISQSVSCPSPPWSPSDALVSDLSPPIGGPLRVSSIAVNLRVEPHRGVYIYATSVLLSMALTVWMRHLARAAVEASTSSVADQQCVLRHP